MIDKLIAAEASKQKSELSPSSIQLAEPPRAISNYVILSVVILSAIAAIVLASRGAILIITLLAIVAVLIFLEAKARKHSSALDPNLKAVLARLEPSNSSETNLAELTANQAVLELLCKFAVMEQKEKLIFDYCSLLLCELNSAGIIIQLNESAEFVWGYCREDLYGASLSELLSVESKKQFEQILDLPNNYPTSKQFELRVRHKNGEFLDLFWHAEWSSKARAFFCRAEDVSERRNSERLRDEVTAMINHDLRSPISSFYYALYNMLDQQYGQLDHRLEEVVSINLRNIRSVLSLLDNLTSAQKRRDKSKESSVRIRRLLFAS
jgi:PAS domain S-box-containing protein